MNFPDNVTLFIALAGLGLSIWTFIRTWPVVSLDKEIKKRELARNEEAETSSISLRLKRSARPLKAEILVIANTGGGAVEEFSVVYVPGHETDERTVRHTIAMLPAGASDQLLVPMARQRPTRASCEWRDAPSGERRHFAREFTLPEDV